MLPFAAEPLIRGPESRLTGATSRWLEIIVRLKSARSRAGQSRAGGPHPPIVQSWTRPPWLTFVSAATGNSSLRARFETPLLAMVVAVGLVLLIACGNIANLMLRGPGRRRKIGVSWRSGARAGARPAPPRRKSDRGGNGCGARAGFRVLEQCGPRPPIRHVADTVSLDLVLDWRVLAFTAARA